MKFGKDRCIHSEAIVITDVYGYIYVHPDIIMTTYKPHTIWKPQEGVECKSTCTMNKHFNLYSLI